MGLAKDCMHNRTSRIGLPVQNSRAGLPGQDSQNNFGYGKALILAFINTLAKFKGTVAQDILFSVFFITLNSSFVSKEIPGKKMILLRKMYCIHKNIIFEVSSELSATA
jgi:hypothetical protein